MELQREDYLDPQCVLCGRPGEPEPVQKVPIGRVLEKLEQYEARNDLQGAERHLKYWLAEAEQNRDERSQLTLNNELMGFYRMRNNEEAAEKHASRALELIERLDMEETITAGTVRVNAATVREAFGDPAGALSLFEKARVNYEKNLSRSDSRLGGLYNNMGLALSACGRYEEAEKRFRQALEVMEKQENGELEQAITWLNLADTAEAARGPEEAEKQVQADLERAAVLLDTEDLPRNSYYAFVCEKCAPVFSRYGWFMQERVLLERAQRIRDRSLSVPAKPSDR